MNSFGRTVSNKIKLRIKSFHRRIIFVEAIKNLLSCKVERSDKPHNYGGSGGNGEVKGSFTYLLEELKATGGYSSSFGRQQSFKKTFQWTFNKSQLVGKVVVFSKMKYRIIEKV